MFDSDDVGLSVAVVVTVAVVVVSLVVVVVARSVEVVVCLPAVVVSAVVEVVGSVVDGSPVVVITNNKKIKPPHTWNYSLTRNCNVQFPF